MDVYTGRDLLTALKLAAGRPGPQIQLVVNQNIRLRIVATNLDYQRSHDVHCLTAWRNKFVNSFLTEFVATETQTARWLAETVGPSDDRILFMADDRDGTAIGYMGIGFIDWKRRYAEADSIVRGRDAEKGGMSLALRTMIEWCQGQLAIEEVGVRVRSDNPALQFYRKFGFVERLRVPLSRRIEGGKTIWDENPAEPNPEVWLVHHTL